MRKLNSLIQGPGPCLILHGKYSLMRTPMSAQCLPNICLISAQFLPNVCPMSAQCLPNVPYVCLMSLVSAQCPLILPNVISSDMFLFYYRNHFTCAYLCNGLDELCSNFVNTLTTENCKTITNNGQGLVKTSSFNKNAVKVWSNEMIQKGL